MLEWGSDTAEGIPQIGGHHKSEHPFDKKETTRDLSGGSDVEMSGLKTLVLRITSRETPLGCLTVSSPREVRRGQ